MSEEALYAYDSHLASLSMATHSPPISIIASVHAERAAQLVHQVDQEVRYRHQLDIVLNLLNQLEGSPHFSPPTTM